MPTVAAAGYPTGPEAPPQIDPRLPVDDYQRIQATPEAFGAQVGQSMSALGRVLTTSADEFRQVAMERQQLHNNVVSDKAINDFNDKANNLLYGDPNALPGSPEAIGYYGLRGQAAIDAYPKMRDALQASREQMRGQLENPMQQLNFDKETRRQMSFEMGRAGSHYDQQYDVFQTATNKAGATLAQQQQERTVGDNAAFNAAVESRMKYEYRQLEAQGLAGDDNEVWAMQQRVRSDAVKTQLEVYAGREDADNLARIINRESGQGGALSAEDALHYRGILSSLKEAAAANRALRPGGGGGGGALNIPTGPIPDAISAAAPQAGVSNRLAMGTASIESGFGQSPDRPGSQYKGVFQLGDKEWEQMGGGDRNDRQLQIDHGLRLLAQRKTELAQSLGREPEDWEVYLAHQQGVAGAKALIQNPNMTAGQAVTQAGGAPVNISGNGGDPNAPSSAFTAHWQQTFERHASRATPSPGAPTAAPATPPATGGAPIAIGDSIARGFQKFGGAGGTGKDLDASDTTVHAAGGRSPSTILTYLKSQPDGSLNGQPVLLSTGVSNGPGQINLVPEQLAELKRMGAGPISVVGVGTKAGEEGGNHYDLNKYNAQIEQAAKAAGATFLGGLPAVVHPAASYYTGAMPKAAPAAAKSPTVTEGDIIHNPKTGEYLQNVGGKLVRYMPPGV